MASNLVRHSLDSRDPLLISSDTRRSNEYSFKLDSGRVVHLIDTPGFNDTNTKDSEILREIAFFLNSMYSQQYDIHGVVFLHRITDQRMGGSALRNLRILQKLCGEAAYSHICLASTMWNQLEDEGVGISREQGLIENANFWAPMKAKGSIISRHRGTVDSAREIVETLIARGTTVLDIQKQMVDQRLDLDGTTVGQYLGEELLEARKKHEKELAELEQALKDATEDNDPQLIRVLKEQQDAQVKLLSRTKTEQQELQVSSKALTLERVQQLADLEAKVSQEERRKENEISALRQQIEILQDDLVDAEVGRSRDMTRAIKDRENLIVNNKRLEHNAIVQQQSSEQERRTLMTRLALKEQELQMYKKRGNSSSSSIGSFFRTIFLYDEGDYHNARSVHRSYHSSYESTQRSTHRPRERSPPRHPSLSQRTFRSHPPVLERRRN